MLLAAFAILMMEATDPGVSLADHSLAEFERAAKICGTSVQAQQLSPEMERAARNGELTIFLPVDIAPTATKEARVCQAPCACVQADERLGQEASLTLGPLSTQSGH
jgi:hypothetical protein